MGGEIFSSNQFTTEDDTLIYTPGVPMVMEEQPDSQPAIGALTASEPTVDALSGNDVIAALGSFLITKDLTPPDDLPDININAFAGLLGSELVTGPSLLHDQDLVPIRDDDQVIGLLQLIGEEGLFAELDGTGLYMTSGISTGIGDDLVLGAAQGNNASFLRGLLTNTLDTGTGNDTVLGVSFLGQENNVGFHSLVGVNVNDAILGIGQDLIAGAAIASVIEGAKIQSVVATGLNVSGELAMGDSLSQQDQADIAVPDGPYNVALGISAVIGQETESGNAGKVFLIGHAAADVSRVTGTDFDDILVGSYLIDVGDRSLVSGIAGLKAGSVDLQGGDNVMLGVVFAEVGDSDFQDVFGLRIENFVSGDGDDIVIGATLVNNPVFAPLASGGIKSFLHGSATAAVLNTGGGEDLILGLAQVGEDGSEIFLDTIGIFNVSMNTGADNDVVIGIGGPASDEDLDSPGSFGIYRAPLSCDNSEVANADVLANGIHLGAGEDFVFARGGDAGVDGVAIHGEAGNDVFDIHSGTGLIDGGDDTDTLILSGNRLDYTIVGHGGDSTAVSVMSLDEVTMLEVVDVEFFQFDDGVFALDVFLGA